MLDPAFEPQRPMQDKRKKGARQGLIYSWVSKVNIQQIRENFLGKEDFYMRTISTVFIPIFGTLYFNGFGEGHIEIAEDKENSPAEENGRDSIGTFTPRLPLP